MSSLENCEVVMHRLQIPLYGDVYLAKWCKVHSIQYGPNMIVVVNKIEFGEPVFVHIKQVIAVEFIPFLGYISLQTLHPSHIFMN